MVFNLKKKSQFSGTYYFQGRNDEKVRERKKREQNTFKRMVGLMGLIIGVVVIIVIRLIYIQVYHNDYYEAKLVTYQVQSKTQDVPRGQIYDRNGTLLVGSEATNVIMYYAPKGIKVEEELLMAKIIANHFDVDISKLTLRDKQDMLIRDFDEETRALITEDEWNSYKAGDLSDTDIYNMKIERITEELINQYYTEEYTLEEAYIYTLMNKDTNGGNVVIENATAEDIAFIGERQNLLRGFTYSHDYTRVYPYGSTMKSLFGSVSTKTQGIPKDESDTLLALGYQLNSRVGMSGLEKQYESLLSGNGASYNLTYDEETGDPILSQLSQGEKGYNLRMAIDWELQEYINNLLENQLRSIAYAPGNQYMDRLYIVLMDPNNGDVIAMCGKALDRATGEIYDFADGAYLEAFAIGSASKGATVYTGFKYGLISPGEVIMDEPMYIQGTPVKASWTKTAMGPLTEVDALAQSSNVYMFNIALRLAESHYTPYQPLYINYESFDKLKRSFGELGLGVKTGIDVPNEERGYQGGDREPQPGNILDASIGQYYTYTPIQMAQYVSTIANGGKRMKPRLVTEAYTNVNGEDITVYTNDVEILDDVSEEKTAFERIQLGFYTGVNGNGILNGIRKNEYVLAAKSGTAEVFDSTGTDYPNQALIAFAPYENPRLSYACIAPREGGSSKTCQSLVGQIFDKYFEKYGLE